MVKQMGVVRYNKIEVKDFVGLTTDTTEWLADPRNATYGDGSTYREIDGQKRYYELFNGVWYLQ